MSGPEPFFREAIAHDAGRLMNAVQLWTMVTKRLGSRAAGSGVSQTPKTYPKT